MKEIMGKAHEKKVRKLLKELGHFNNACVIDLKDIKPGKSLWIINKPEAKALNIIIDLLKDCL